eukprot:s3486_g6.t1
MVSAAWWPLCAAIAVQALVPPEDAPEFQRRGRGEKPSETTQSCSSLPHGVKLLYPPLHSPYPAGRPIMVGCPDGWESKNYSRITWKIMCRGSGGWKAENPPGCKILLCQHLLDDFGAWRGARHFNASQKLSCADGYVVEGAAELTCMSSGRWDRMPGRCLPNGGNAELWRSRLRYSALLSLMSLLATAVVAAVVCVGIAPPKAESGQQGRPSLPVAIQPTE